MEKAQALAERVFDLSVVDASLTVEELVPHLGISRATFFRLFGSKEVAMFMAISGPPQLTGEALRAAPPLQAGQSLWSLLRFAFEPVVIRAEQDPDRFISRISQLRSLSEIHSGAGKARLPRILGLATALEERGIAPDTARIFAASAVAAFETCLSLWALSDAPHSLRQRVDTAFAALAAG